MKRKPKFTLIRWGKTLYGWNYSWVAANSAGEKMYLERFMNNEREFIDWWSKPFDYAGHDRTGSLMT